MAPINLARFDLDSLRLFVAVVNGGSLTAGAASFGISLAAASKRIGELEHHTGTDLLARSARGVIATPAGQTLYRHALDVTASLEQLAVAMTDYQRGARGHVRLWANTSAVNGFLPGLLAGYAAEWPDIKIDLEEALSDDVVRAVMTGAADLGVFSQNTAREGLRCVVCDEDDLVLLVPREHRSAGRRRISFAEALDQDFVGLSRGTSLVRLLQSAAESTGREMRVRVQVRSFDAVCRMVAAGLGVAVLPRSAAGAHAASMRLAMLALTESWARRRLMLGWREHVELSVPARALAERIENREVSPPGAPARSSVVPAAVPRPVAP